ncbi:hypothetical protein BN1051_02343 [Arthrobacter saudimassiliensis]|uniref:Uncharacterized protein n=1 Tax=Arthrobacter saudimassiliensis TaxID=1461584 RepID=A0A078MRT3_9MICC|nr:hypothetical protein BN1051_02343 [Arthrobacter saudimassiliensis]
MVSLLCAGALGWAAGESAAVDQAVRSAAHSYDTEGNGRLLDRDEQALLSRLGQLVPEDAVVVGNPWTGTALVYALADRAALTPHVFWTDTADSWLILNHLDEAVPGGEVCAAIERTGAYYALDFGTVGVHGEAPDPPGLDNLADNPSVQLIDQAGQARLYRVTACAEGP